MMARIGDRLVCFDQNAASEFNSSLDKIEMEDMPSRRFWFTWSNKRGDMGENKCKIDTALVNTTRMDISLIVNHCSWLMHFRLLCYIGQSFNRRITEETI